MTNITTTEPVVLRAEDVDALPMVPLDALAGVTHRVLWRNETSMAGVMHIAGGHHLGRHTHRTNHHHMWVLDGRATILGTELTSGAYVHIPAGTEHDIDATDTDGCAVYYLYLRG